MQVRMYLFQKGSWQRMTLEREEPMPGPLGERMTVAQFCAGSRTELVWSDERALAALDRLLRRSPVPLQVVYAFRRGGERAHAGQSGHLAGLAFDLAAPTLPRHRWELIRCALDCGFARVEPVCLTPCWLHAEWCLPGTLGAYPALQRGDAGVHVLAAQDALLAAGTYRAGLTGTFTEETERALHRFCARQGLPRRERLDGFLWNRLLQAAKKAPDNADA